MSYLHTIHLFLLVISYCMCLCYSNSLLNAVYLMKFLFEYLSMLVFLGPDFIVLIA